MIEKLSGPCNGPGLEAIPKSAFLSFSGRLDTRLSLIRHYEMFRDCSRKVKDVANERREKVYLSEDLLQTLCYLPLPL